MANKNFNFFAGRTQLLGMATVDTETGSFFFAPDNPRPGITPGRRVRGVAQQLPDGTFDFVPQSWQTARAQSALIRKLGHGRLSYTCDGAVQLTLKVWGAGSSAIDLVNAGVTMLEESAEAAEALRREALDMALKNGQAKTGRRSA